MPGHSSIPLSRPFLTGREREYIDQVLEARHLSGDGPFTRRCSEHLASATGARRVLLTTSCTHALEMSALLLGIGPGDEVIIPSFTFVSTANAFYLRGARPVFVDVRADTLNLDESLLADAISDSTRAIVPVHYAGVGSAMDEIMSIAEDHQIAVVEDNAHALFGLYRGKPLGSFGALAAQSFHETKNFVCGEGGALLINDESLIERAEIIREKGTNRSRFFRGEVDKYTWVDVGSSYLPSEILAAVLAAQLEAASEIQARRAAIFVRYRTGLADWAESNDVSLPHVPGDCESTHHLFHLVLPSATAREGLAAHLGARSIKSAFHFLPLHLSPIGRQLGGEPGACPVTERVADTLLRIPFFGDMSELEQDRVIEAISEFSC